MQLFGNSLLFVSIFFACGAIAQQSSDEDIVITSDQAHLDLATNHVVYTGNVLIVQGKTNIKANEVTLDQGEQTLSFVATGSPAVVKINKFNKATNSYSPIDITANKILFKQTDTDFFEFIGHAKVITESNSIESEHVTYDSKSGKILALSNKNTSEQVRLVIKRKQ